MSRPSPVLLVFFVLVALLLVLARDPLPGLRDFAAVVSELGEAAAAVR